MALRNPFGEARRNLFQDARQDVFDVSRKSARNREQELLRQRYGVTDQNTTRKKVDDLMQGDQNTEEKSS